MLTVMIVDDDPFLCTAMRRKIEMIDRENQLGIIWNWKRFPTLADLPV